MDSSVVTMMHAVRGYFRFAHIDGLINSDPADTLRVYRVLHLVGKGNKPATNPLTVPVLRVLEACRGQRTSGPLVVRPISGQPISPTRLPAHTAIDLALRSRPSEHCPDPPDECVPPRLVLRQTYK